VASVIVRSNRKTGPKFLNCIDPVKKVLAEESQLEQRLREIAHVAQIDWPVTRLETKHQYKNKEKKRYCHDEHYLNRREGGKSFHG
jgi:hypothetical protein